ncbi:MAG: RluA family pseudouridine synthase [Gammaproteobacteria bacterium]|nr:RluA family pseudouridine synthase [Gammaproteobacteria bacterium]
MSSPTDPQRAAVRQVVVENDQAGQRIDNFLLRCLKGVPRSYVYRILRSGEVRVNKGRIKPTYRLAADDRIRIPPVRSGNRTPVAAPAALCERLETAILLEDEDLIALDKPSGLAVHGGGGVDYGVIEILRQARPHAPQLELVHRLDRGTSGCLLLAKSRSMLNALHRLLHDGGIDKHYLALVQGRWAGGARRVTAALERLPEHSRVTTDAHGKHAVSLFMPVARFGNSSLMDVSALSGRTHQIRVHAAHLGQPIAGDDRYGDHGFNREMRARGLRRLFLHASRLDFRIPNSGKRYSIEAPLEPRLQQVVENLAGC